MSFRPLASCLALVLNDKQTLRSPGVVKFAKGPTPEKYARLSTGVKALELSSCFLLEFSSRTHRATVSEGQGSGRVVCEITELEQDYQGIFIDQEGLARILTR
ncbi:hypothetical protein Bbelb_002270 [Branchiostoma belcheri]|nr:hypothetical protein Bbelb_002270 [Branchiostoma belcheri]